MRCWRSRGRIRRPRAGLLGAAVHADSRREDIELFDEAFSRLREPEPPDQPDLNPGATPKPDRRQLPNEPSQGIERMAADQELVMDGEGEAAESGMRWVGGRAAARARLRPVLRGRAPARVTARRAPREGDAAAALAQAAARLLRAGVRYTADAARGDAQRRLSTRSRVAGSEPRRTPAAVRGRRVGLDAALRASDDDVSAGRGPRRPPGRGVHAGHAADPRDARACIAQSRSGTAGCDAGRP